MLPLTSLLFVLFSPRVFLSKFYPFFRWTKWLSGFGSRASTNDSRPSSSPMLSQNDCSKSVSHSQLCRFRSPFLRTSLFDNKFSQEVFFKMFSRALLPCSIVKWRHARQPMSSGVILNRYYNRCFVICTLRLPNIAF